MLKLERVLHKLGMLNGRTKLGNLQYQAYQGSMS